MLSSQGIGISRATTSITQARELSHHLRVVTPVPKCREPVELSFYILGLCYFSALLFGEKRPCRDKQGGNQGANDETIDAEQ